MSEQIESIPEPEEASPRRRLGRFVGDVGRWVRLCERQGTRLVDLIERWVEAAEEHNRQTERLADVAERLAATGELYLGTGDPAPEEEGGDHA